MFIKKKLIAKSNIVSEFPYALSFILNTLPDKILVIFQKSIVSFVQKTQTLA